MCTMRAEDQDFTAEFTLRLQPRAHPHAPPPLHHHHHHQEQGPAGAQPAEAEPRPQQAEPQEVGCIVLWFETAFSPRHCAEHPVVLSTSPFQPPTHWAQTLLTLRRPVPLAAAPAEPASSSPADPVPAARSGASVITGRISVVRSRQEHRSLDIALQYRAEVSDGSVIEEAQLYHMSVTAPS